MKYSRIIYVLLMLLLMACGKNTPLTPPPPQPSTLAFGTPLTLDVVTWNLLNFPRTETDTAALASIINTIGADVYAFQEIDNPSSFLTFAASIPNYAGIVSSASSDTRLAYLYDTRTVVVNSQYPILTGNSNPFPRPPYVLDFTWEGQDYYILNNHLKAFGDNVIDEDDSWDEEVRRRLACQTLDNYISTSLADDRVIVLGDMNDQIQEPRSSNVFLNFLDNTSEYMFADLPLAENPINSNVSYPSSGSHLDHILITNELFDDFVSGGSYCRTILAEDWFGSWNTYKQLISDHRPVGIRLNKR